MRTQADFGGDGGMSKIEIIHGDCLEVMKSFSDKQFDLVLTDPPYGIDYQSAWRSDKSDWKPKIANDEKPFVEWISEAYRVLVDGGRLLCFYRWDVQDAFLFELRQVGFTVKSQIIWDKIIHGMGDLNGEYAPQHECILYATKGRYEFRNKRPTTVIQCQRVEPEKLLHPNEKPVKLIRKLIRQTTIDNENILDCFLGSGTTVIASEHENRNCVGIEISPEYCEIARKRVQAEKDKMGLFAGTEA